MAGRPKWQQDPNDKKTQVTKNPQMIRRPKWQKDSSVKRHKWQEDTCDKKSE